MFKTKVTDSFDGKSQEYIVIGLCDTIVASFRVSDGLIYSLSFNTTNYSEIQDIMRYLQNEESNKTL